MLKKIFKIVAISVAILLGGIALVASAVSYPYQGGTGTTSTPSLGTLLIGKTQYGYSLLGVSAGTNCLITSSTAPLGVVWSTCPGGGTTPGGNMNDIQTNDGSGGFAGNSGFTYDGTGSLGLGTIPVSLFDNGGTLFIGGASAGTGAPVTIAGGSLNIGNVTALDNSTGDIWSSGGLHLQSGGTGNLIITQNGSGVLFPDSSFQTTAAISQATTTITASGTILAGPSFSFGTSTYIFPYVSGGKLYWAFSSSSLGLGSASVRAATDFLTVANNLSDLNSTSSARTNIGFSGLAPLSISSTGTIIFTNPGYITTSTNNFGGHTGAGTSTWLAFFTGTSTLTGNASITYTTTTGVLAAPTGSFTNVSAVNTTSTNGTFTTLKDANGTKYVTSTASGVSSVNTLTGAVTLTGLNGIAVSTSSATNINIAPPTSTPTLYDMAPSSTDDIPYKINFPYAATLKEVDCENDIAAGNTFTFNITWGTKRNSTSSNAFTSNQVCTATSSFAALTPNGSTTIAAGSQVRVVFSAASSTAASIQLNYL